MPSLDLGAVGEPPRRTAHEYVRASLRAAILRGSLPGGSRLVQADVARELGVSTTPVREALRDLATEGLVVLDAHRGGLVKRLSFAELQEIHELCRILEPEAMRRAIGKLEADHFTQATELCSAMDDEDDPARWADLNREFHALLTGAAASERLAGILEGLRDSVAPYVALAHRARGSEHIEIANREHRALLEALAAGDSDRSAEIMRGHVDLTVESLDESRHLFDDHDATAGADAP